MQISNGVAGSEEEGDDMKIAMIGLGKMGAAMAERLRRNGHDVVGYDRDPDKADVASLADAVAALDGEARRVVWVMVPAGGPTNSTITELADLLGEGDLVVDGGNSNFRDSQRDAELLAGHGIAFVDAGVSGGVWGLQEGYCIMAGGAVADIDHLRPVLDALVTEDGFAHVGPVGAGHFTKMVHNGVEYALMEAYAEGYELLAAADLDIDVQATLEVWRHGSVVRSWLLDLLADGLASDPDLASVRGYAEDSGEGRWTLQEAIAHAVPAPAIAAAVFARFVSRQDDSPAMRAIATLRNQFGGHAVRSS
jgi:6-phosphogluconate dehydrogenase